MLPALARGTTSIASTVLLGVLLAVAELDEPVAPIAPENPELPDWSMPEDELVLPELPLPPLVPVPMVPLLLELPLLPVGLPEASVALPEP